MPCRQNPLHAETDCVHRVCQRRHRKRGGKGFRAHWNYGYSFPWCRSPSWHCSTRSANGSRRATSTSTSRHRPGHRPNQFHLGVKNRDQCRFIDLVALLKAQFILQSRCAGRPLRIYRSLETGRGDYDFVTCSAASRNSIETGILTCTLSYAHIVGIDANAIGDQPPEGHISAISKYRGRDAAQEGFQEPIDLPTRLALRSIDVLSAVDYGD